MDTSETGPRRPLAEVRSVDEPGPPEVAALLAEWRSMPLPAPTEAVVAQHLAAIRDEVRNVAASAAAPVRPNRRRRSVVTAIGAAFGTLTIGVGAAAAMGGNPLHLLPGLLPGPTPTVSATSPAAIEGSDASSTNRPTDQGTVGGPAATGRPSEESAVAPAASPSANTSPTAAPGKSGEDHGKGGDEHGKPTSRANQGKSAAAQESHKPTPKPKQTKQTKADPPGRADESDSSKGAAAGGSEDSW